MATIVRRTKIDESHLLQKFLAFDVISLAVSIVPSSRGPCLSQGCNTNSGLVYGAPLPLNLFAAIVATKGALWLLKQPVSEVARLLAPENSLFVFYLC